MLHLCVSEPHLSILHNSSDGVQGPKNNNQSNVDRMHACQ